MTDDPAVQDAADRLRNNFWPDGVRRLAHLIAVATVAAARDHIEAEARAEADRLRVALDRIVSTPLPPGTSLELFRAIDAGLDALDAGLDAPCRRRRIMTADPAGIPKRWLAEASRLRKERDAARAEADRLRSLTCTAALVTDDGHAVCDQPQIHDGDHTDGDQRWPRQTCDTDLHEAMGPTVTLRVDGQERVLCLVCAARLTVQATHRWRTSVGTAVRERARVGRVREAGLALEASMTGRANQHFTEAWEAFRAALHDDDQDQDDSVWGEGSQP